MSNYIERLKNPKTGKPQDALCIDDFYGKHQYGYGFRKDGKNADLGTEIDECNFYKKVDIGGDKNT